MLRGQLDGCSPDALDTGTATCTFTGSNPGRVSADCSLDFNQVSFKDS